MKRNLLTFTLIISTLFFSACGGVTQEKKEVHQAVLGVSQSTTKMKINKPYNLYKGESIVPISVEPELLIETDIKTGATTATLLHGEAKIVIVYE